MTATVTSINATRAERAIAALEKLSLEDLAGVDFATASRLHNLCKQWELKSDGYLKLQQGMIPIRWPWGAK